MASPVETNKSAGAEDAACIPWLTVIMPCYRGEQWIAAALRSLAAEAADGMEVWVIDSSPTSAARDIALGFADRLRVHIVERCDLASWQSKTNFGVTLARSDHICWLGVDDVW